MDSRKMGAKIISNNRIAKTYYLLILEVPSGLKKVQPGQFVHIRISESCDPLLRRPFSVHKIASSQVKKKGLLLYILYELKGKGTKLLSEKRVGEQLDILGPLGRGFDLGSNGHHDCVNIIIAGGAGVAPLYFLASKLTANKFKKNKIIVLIGSGTRTKILAEQEFKDLGCDVRVATDDGTRGYKGKVTKLFEKTLDKIAGQAHKAKKPAPINVYACGPEAMLTELSKLCIIKKIPLQVSLEEFMGCGIGACMGCAIKTKSGYKRVCHDGPVFDAQEIAWKF